MYLSSKTIETLASKEKVRKIAVENFLGTANKSLPKESHLMNLQMDQQLYKWNPQTVNAIKKGLNILYKK